MDYLLEFRSTGAINREWETAFGVSMAGLVKDKAIRAQLIDYLVSIISVFNEIIGNNLITKLDQYK